jgi:NDP-4-keto-2,6-dideoxyhexose 3-C-methyltransferase
MHKKISSCRICGNTNLEIVLDLGEQMLTGIFPSRIDPEIATKGPLILVKCSNNQYSCGLLQLEHSYNKEEMYGKNYGYRSGLNNSMVAHLHSKVDRIISMINLEADDLVIDIGSNDGTTLAAYSHDLNLVGIDPTGFKYSKYYLSHIKLIPEFFSAQLIENSFPLKKAKVITSFSMFYDLEDPINFMREIYRILDENGIWVFEQSYLPTMIETNSFDTVCHEHLEFYCLKQIQYMAKKIGFLIIDVEFNSINGGSFSVTMKKNTKNQEISPEIKSILQKETDLGYDTLLPYILFKNRIKFAKENLLNFIRKAKDKGKFVAGLGASTKGNVLLQFCKLNKNDIPFIGEVNTEKFGCYTPGSWIPIISETELLKMKPDYLIVFPWHFRNFFVNNDKFKEISLVFPLPNLEIVGKKLI